MKHDYALSNAPFETPLREFARVLSAEHRVEECLRRAKGESGLAQYQVRTWRGLASSSNAHIDSDLVSDAREASGGKRLPRVSRFRRYVTSSDNCCMRNFKPTRCIIFAIKQHDSIVANRPPASIIGKNTNAYHR